MSSLVLGVALVLLSLLSPALSPTAGAATDACPYTGAELSAALGLSLENGTGTETPFPGGKMMTCEYKGKATVGVSLSQTKSATSSDAKMVAKGLQGQAIAGDPDGAIWVSVMGDSSRLSLSYVRATTHMEFSVVGINSKHEAEAKPMRDKMLKLRRVP